MGVVVGVGICGSGTDVWRKPSFKLIRISRKGSCSVEEAMVNLMEG